MVKRKYYWWTLSLALFVVVAFVFAFTEQITPDTLFTACGIAIAGGAILERLS